ncbi:amidase [Agromyces sp. MMS24-JH15]|uniref:amidase n=1 Tax=Agromyces sp. MMS24-JH15 TaxID=3243765 RepID=UPI00374A6252
MSELHELTALDLHRALQRGEASPTDAVRAFLDRIARLDPQVGAFAHVAREAALERAALVEHELPRVAPLWGMPLADKDLHLRAGHPAGFGSRAFADFVPDASDALVRDLDRAGAVSLGRTRAPEFGLPSYTESATGWATRNPWDVALGAGGSSGGAAAAVAAGMLPFATGSDGGGSIRIPAASCGVVGVKPSRGRVPSGSGLDRLAGLGVVGPLARTVADAALLLDGLVGPVGYPAGHPFAVRAPGTDGPYLGAAIRGEGRFQVGVLADSPWDLAYDVAVGPAALAAVEAATALLDRLGHGVEAIPPAPEPGYPDAFRVIWQASAATIPVEADRLDLLEPLSAWLVRRGRALGARELAEAIAWLAEFEQRTIRRFSGFDAVLTPALAQSPRPVGWYDAEDGEENFAQQVRFTPFTSFVNVAGLPALTVPVLAVELVEPGRPAESGPPVSVQLIGRPGGEETLFAIAAQLERAARIAGRRPPVW